MCECIELFPRMLHATATPTDLCKLATSLKHTGECNGAAKENFLGMQALKLISMAGSLHANTQVFNWAKLS